MKTQFKRDEKEMERRNKNEGRGSDLLVDRIFERLARVTTRPLPIVCTRRKTDSLGLIYHANRHLSRLESFLNSSTYLLVHSCPPPHFSTTSYLVYLTGLPTYLSILFTLSTYLTYLLTSPRELALKPHPLVITLGTICHRPAA